MKTKREIAARLTELRNELTEVVQQNPDPDNAWLRKLLRIQASIGVLDWVLREDQAMMMPAPPADRPRSQRFSRSRDTSQLARGGDGSSRC